MAWKRQRHLIALLVVAGAIGAYWGACTFGDRGFAEQRDTTHPAKLRQHARLLSLTTRLRIRRKKGLTVSISRMTSSALRQGRIR